MDEFCDGCVYFRHIRDDVGHCHRYAPRPVQWAETENENGDRGDNDAVWPLVAVDEWCGEFAPKRQEHDQ